MNYKYLVSTVLLGFLSLGAVSAASPSSVVLINAYDKDEIAGTYTLTQLGSAVVIDNDTIITNAHVVLDPEQEASYVYEVCETKALDQKPHCFSTATLKKYNSDEDLAVLKLDTPSSTTLPVSFTNTMPVLGEAVQVLGYPGYGGKTITQTEGKISGFEQGFYKIDANLDSGNSGGGAFNAQGEFVGVPTFVSVGYSTLGYIVPYTTVREILSSNGGNGTTIVSSENELSDGFRAFSQKKYTVTKNPAKITTPYASIQNAKALGFSVDSYRKTEQENGPEEIIFSDKKGKTTVRVTTHGIYDPNNLREKQAKQYDTKTLKDTYKTVLRKDIKRNGHTWQVTYIDGGNVTPGAKVLSFLQRDTTGGATAVIIETSDQKLDMFVNGILLFLKFTDITQKNYSIEDYISLTKDLIDLEGMFPVYGYGFSSLTDGVELTYSFGGGSEYDGKIQIQEFDVDEEFEEITYTEFGEYLRLIFGRAFAEQEGTTVGEGMMVKNSQGSVYYSIPIAAETDGETMKMALSYFIFRKGDKILVYIASTPFFESASAKQKALKFLDTVKIPTNHGFKEYGVETSEMSSVQDLMSK